MVEGDAPLSYSADELLGILERRVHREASAPRWLAELAAHDPAMFSSVLASVRPGRDPDTVIGDASTVAGPALTRATLADRASRRAAELGAPVAQAADVVAALVDLTEEVLARRPPDESTSREPQPAPAAGPASRPLAAPAPSSPGRTRTFRVFVSSTFEDFRVERDVLRREVWPHLRELCAAAGARFQPIDLRWGVSEEAAVDQQTMNICLGEIERCQQVTPRPDFLVLLGNRYGWRPPPPQIPAEEYDRIITWLRTNPDETGPDETKPDERGHEERGPEETGPDETGPAETGPDTAGSSAATGPVPSPDDVAPAELLARWYERDDNAVPPEYRLRRRTGAYLDPDRWSLVENRLVRAISTAAARLGGLPGRYLHSATAQEIAAGALEVADRDQAVCFIREIELPVPVADDRHLRRYVDRDQGRLADLKRAVVDHLGQDRVVSASVPWGATAPAFDESYKRRFAEGVREALARSIRDELDHPRGAESTVTHAPGDALDEELAAHRGFAAERRQSFTGRVEELADIQAYLDAGEPRPLVVCGEGGSGKTALLAEALERAVQGSTSTTVVARFVGATPGSADGRSLLTSMSHELARATGETEIPVPTDSSELVKEFARRLAAAAAVGPVWVFVDSLDQLAGTAGVGARSLTWVPQPLPPGVRMVLSTREGDTLDRLRGRAELLALGGLTRLEGDTLLDKWLAARKRALQPAQRQAVLDAFVAAKGNPLYLKLAFEEASRWVSGDGQPPEELAVGIPELIRQNLLDRLASEDSHGELVVGRALGYLAASRHGLAEDELTDLLSRDRDLYRWFLLGAFHLPEDLVDSARAYPGRPPDVEPAAWLTGIREAALILDERPWELYGFLQQESGQTIEDIARRTGRQRLATRRVLSRLAAAGLAGADEQGAWSAVGSAPSAADPRLAWSMAYRAANGGERWPFPQLDAVDIASAHVGGPDEDLVAQIWLDHLGGWATDLDSFLAAVVPARVPAPDRDAQRTADSARDADPQLVARPRPGPELPVVFWSRLSFDLAPYLTERRTEAGDLLGFYHRELSEVAGLAYAHAGEGRTLHDRLADYFMAEADPRGDRSWTTGDERGADIRGLSELPYHLTRAERWDDVFDVLTDFRFLEQKATHVGATTRTEADRMITVYTGVFQLQDDYETALRRMPGGTGEAAGRPRLIVTAVDLGDGLVVRCPHCNTVHAVGRACSSCKTVHHLAEWRGRDITCPAPHCQGPLRVNDFVVPSAN